MLFEDFQKDGKVIKGEKDFQKAKALIKMSDDNLKTAMGIDIDGTTASTVFGIMYESLRELIEAMCLTKGLKVYSHEAFTYYLLELGEENISYKFDRLRKIRNRANYYGKKVSEEVTKDAKKQIKEVRAHLKSKYLRDL